MTDDQPEISVISPTESASATSADDDRWLTYLNYDRTIQQAVRRLGALSSANVDEFRALLLKGRDRSRVNDYEAESIRRLQGEAFVGDEDLQRALIVLNAEDPRLGEELKRVIAATGKPQELDQTVAAIRAQIAAPNPSVPMQPGRAQKNQTRANPAPITVQEPPRRPHTEPVSVIATRAQPQQAEQPPWAKRLAIPGAIAAVAAVGLFLVLPRFMTGDTQKIASAETVPLRPAASDDPRAALPDAPSPAAQAAPPAPTVPAPQNDIQKAEIENPAPGRVTSTVAGAPDKASPQKVAASPDTPPTPMPVPGANYRVVRGDMLSEIALQAYHDASKFRIIQLANPSLRNKPDLILVDQTIYIPPAS